MAEVDHPTTASLAPAFRTPAEFPQPSGPRNDVTRGWIPDQLSLRGTVVFSGQEAINPRREGTSLNDHHDYTPMAYQRQCPFRAPNGWRVSGE